MSALQVPHTLLSYMSSGLTLTSTSWGVGPLDSSTHFMWFGPYTSTKVSSQAQACWRYASYNAPGVANSAYLDFRMTDSKNVVHTFFQSDTQLATDNYTRQNFNSSPSFVSPTHLFCTPMLKVPAGNYHNVEVRVKHDSLQNSSGYWVGLEILRTKYTTY